MLNTVQNKGFYNFTEEKDKIVYISNLSLCDLLVYFQSSPHFVTDPITHQPKLKKKIK